MRNKRSHGGAEDAEVGRRTRRHGLCASVVVLGSLAQVGRAAVLEVGADKGLHTLAEAMAQAQDGDTVRLEAGSYFECATVRRRDLVIEGAGTATVLTDATCDGKAIIVAQGDRLTVRDLVLARARVGDMNGAGIRLEGQGLTVERVGFENDQVGVLAGAAGPGEVRLLECVLSGGGVGGDRPGWGVSVGEVALLRIERTRFVGRKGGGVSSLARRTEVVGGRIEVGAVAEAEGGGAGFAVLVGAGTLSMEGTVVAVGPNRPPRDAALLADGDGAALRGVRLENTTGHAMTLLLDWMHADPVLDRNLVGFGDAETSSSGVWRHRAGGVAHGMWDGVRWAAGGTKRAVFRLFGR